MWKGTKKHFNERCLQSDESVAFICLAHCIESRKAIEFTSWCSGCDIKIFFLLTSSLFPLNTEKLVPDVNIDVTSVHNSSISGMEHFTLTMRCASCDASETCSNQWIYDISTRVDYPLQVEILLHSRKGHLSERAELRGKNVSYRYLLMAGWKRDLGSQGFLKWKLFL